VIDPVETNPRDRRQRPSPWHVRLLPEINGKRISWVGLISPEPMVRGCDQGAWFERQAKESLRHIVIPLNGPHEDTCLFARRRHEPATGKQPASVVYDLEHRDEGALTRLKYLLEAARAAGVMVGLSLFPGGDPTGTPLHPTCNIQQLGLNTEPSPRLTKALQQAADSISSAVRGCKGVWIEPFRGLGAHGSELNRTLARRIAETLAKHGEDLAPLPLGPWVAANDTGGWPESLNRQILPCDASAEIVAPAMSVADLLQRIESRTNRPLAETFFAPYVGRPRLLRFAPGALLPAQHDWLWQALLRGYWPLVALASGPASASLQRAVASVAQFSALWMSRGRLRAAPELLSPSCPEGAVAASDGATRSFVFFPEGPRDGVTLHLPAGSYRYYWVDPLAGTIVDRADGVEGRARSAIPGSANADARMLVLESEDAPDNLTTW
jgi:hypothetical protein